MSTAFSDNQQGIAIALAWPDMWIPQTNTWYDHPMRWIGVNKNGRYKVGHSAVLLLHPAWKTARYFDFGRYGTTGGLGRVRSEDSDAELAIQTIPVWNEKGVKNLSAILKEIHQNKHTHGKGRLVASVCTQVNVSAGLLKASQWQAKGAISYGPFTLKGTNCSRFTSSVLRNVETHFFAKLALWFPLTVSPTPLWNVVATCGMKNYIEIVDAKIYKVSKRFFPFPKKTTHKIHDFMWV